MTARWPADKVPGLKAPPAAQPPRQARPMTLELDAIEREELKAALRSRRAILEAMINRAKTSDRPDLSLKRQKVADLLIQISALEGDR